MAFTLQGGGNGAVTPAAVVAAIAGQDITLDTLTMTGDILAAQGFGVYFNTAGTHRIYDDGTGLFANASFSVGGSFVSVLAADGTVSTHGLTVHDTGIGASGGLHLTKGDDATAFVPYLRSDDQNSPMTIGGGRTADGATFTPQTFDGTSGYQPWLQVIENITPASGSGTFSTLELNATLNGVSSGTYAALAIAPVVTAFTGGTTLLIDAGTTTTNYGTGYVQKFEVDTDGNVACAGFSRVEGNLTCNALAVQNAVAATTPGSVVQKIEVFDGSGTSLGFVPVYSSIS